MTLVVLLLSCGQSDEPECNEECTEYAETPDAEYVPYGWCHTVQDEHRYVEGSFLCTASDGLLDDNVAITMKVSESDLSEIRITSIVVDELCIEVVQYPVRVSFESPQFSAELESFVQIMAELTGDRTIVIDGVVGLYEIEGSLFEDFTYDPWVEAYSRTDIGMDRKAWRLQLGTWEGERWVFECN